MSVSAFVRVHLPRNQIRKKQHKRFVLLIIELDRPSKHYLFVQREVNLVFQAVIYAEHRNDTSERKGRQVSVKQTRD